MSDCILVIDEGTTSSRAIIFDRDFQQIALAQIEVPLTFPADGWVEQDANTIWQASLAACQQAIAQIGGPNRLAALAIANQRETTIAWNRNTSQPVCPAIAWQDRRTHAVCERLKADGHEASVQAVTGLLLDPYFSATKLGWMIENGKLPVDAASDYAFGTVDSWLIWKLTGGRVHATDITNASRTLLMDLERGAWSGDMCALMGVPLAMLPEIRASGGVFGETDEALFGKRLPILSAIGDQQAALVGQGCLAPGLAKITLGTGAFLVANTGTVRPQSQNALLATSGYDTGTQAAYALEGAIFNAGTVVQWLRDELGLISSASDSEDIAAKAGDNGGVYFVPAFTGLGAPHWRADARGEITGLTRATRAHHIVRAGLEACAYQTHDLITAFRSDGARIAALRVDGGMAANDWLMQFMADICDVPVERADYAEMTALGACALAAMQLDWTSETAWMARRASARQFTPTMAADTRTTLLEGWQVAVGKAIRTRA